MKAERGKTAPHLHITNASNCFTEIDRTKRYDEAVRWSCEAWCWSGAVFANNVLKTSPAKL